MSKEVFKEVNTWEEVISQMKQDEEDINNSYPLPNIIWDIKSRWMRWADHAVVMGNMRNAQAYSSVVGNLNGRHHLQKVGVDGRLFLKYTYIKKTGHEGLDSIVLAQDGAQWSAFVNIVVKFRVHEMWGVSCPAMQLKTSQKGPSKFSSLCISCRISRVSSVTRKK